MICFLTENHIFKTKHLKIIFLKQNFLKCLNTDFLTNVFPAHSNFVFLDLVFLVYFDLGVTGDSLEIDIALVRILTGKRRRWTNYSNLRDEKMDKLFKSERWEDEQIIWTITEDSGQIIFPLQVGSTTTRTWNILVTQLACTDPWRGKLNIIFH